ncbi:MAG: gluconate 2-dehydrogenase subunit 3 family protein [Burkholderiales bacterium]
MNEALIPSSSSPADDDLSRRQWLLRLGEMVVLAGVSGLVPESASALLRAAQDMAPAAAALPPGLYDPSPEHLVHALSSAGKKWSPPVGSETDYVQPSSLPYKPQFFSADEFRVVTRFVEILLGQVDATAMSQAAQWFDLWLHSAAGVREAARHLDPMHRALAVAVNGEASVRDLETADPQSVARAGLAALRDLSLQAHGREFLQLDAQQQITLLTSGAPGDPLRKFFDIARTEAVRGYYTTAAGLEELDYRGNAYYADSLGCEAKPGKSQ